MLAFWDIDVYQQSENSSKLHGPEFLFRFDWIIGHVIELNLHLLSPPLRSGCYNLAQSPNHMVGLSGMVSFILSYLISINLGIIPRAH